MQSTSRNWLRQLARARVSIVSLLREELRAPTVWPALDGIRGVAVIAAVTWHVLRLYPAANITSASVPVVLWPLGTLRFAVDAFFVLSGFLVVRSWQATRGSSGVVRAWSSFIGRRAARIFPGYWFSLLVLVPLVAPVLFEQPRRLLAFVTLNQYVKYWLPERVNVVYWSLTTEWHFYLLVPALSWLVVRIGRWPLLAGTFVMSIAWYFDPPFRLPASFIFGRLDQFVAGAVVGQLLSMHVEGTPSAVVRVVRARYAGWVILLALVGLGTYHGSSFGMGRGTLLDAAMHPLVGLLMGAGLLRVLLGYVPSMLLHNVARFFGVVSFGLYIWHYPVLQHGRVLTELATPLPVWARSGAVVAALLGLSVAAATTSYFLVERPFVRRSASSRKPVGGEPDRVSTPS